MKVRMYNLISELVERGAAHGYRRAFKHTDSPSEGYTLQAIHDSIMNELAEYIIFEDIGE